MPNKIIKDYDSIVGLRKTDSYKETIYAESFNEGKILGGKINKNIIVPFWNFICIISFKIKKNFIYSIGLICGIFYPTKTEETKNKTHSEVS